MIAIVNQYFNDNICQVFDMIGNKKVLAEKEETTILTGSYFYTQSCILGKAKQSTKTSRLVRNLAFLGHLYSVNMVENEKTQMFMLLIPKTNAKIKDIIKPAVKRYEKKDGTIVYMSRLGDDRETEIMAVCYLQIIMDFYSHKNLYEKVIIMKTTISGNNAMPDKYLNIDILDYSHKLLERLHQVLTISSKADNIIEIKDVTAKFLLFKDYRYFSQLINVYSKK